VTDVKLFYTHRQNIFWQVENLFKPHHGFEAEKPLPLCSGRAIMVIRAVFIHYRTEL
jgi:hypothetical protein